MNGIKQDDSCRDNMAGENIDLKTVGHPGRVTLKTVEVNVSRVKTECV